MLSRFVASNNLRLVCKTVVGFWLLVTTAASCFAGVAGVTGLLSDFRHDAVSQTLEIDLSLAFDNSLQGQLFELLDLDIIETKLNNRPFERFSLFEFATASPFSDWYDGTLFQDLGTPPTGLETRLLLYSPVGNSFTIVDTQPVLFGTLTLNYGPLGLKDGDSITIDLAGAEFPDPNNPAQNTRTTALFLQTPDPNTDGDFYLPAFSPRNRTFVLGGGPVVIPEPTSGSIFLLAVGAGLLARRRK